MSVNLNAKTSPQVSVLLSLFFSLGELRRTLPGPCRGAVALPDLPQYRDPHRACPVCLAPRCAALGPAPKQGDFCIDLPMTPVPSLLVQVPPWPRASGIPS